MASSSSTTSSSNPTPNSTVASAQSPNFTTGYSTSTIACPAIGIKLTGDNYVVWKARLLPFLRASRLISIVDGTSPCPPSQISTTGPDGVVQVESNPTYEDWCTRDQIALGWILSTTTDAIVGQLTNFVTSTDAWRFLAASYAAHNSARATHLRMQLQTLRKGNQTVTEFLQQITTIVDQLASIGEIISPHEYQTHVFRGLGADFQSLAVAISVQNQSQAMTRDALHGLLLSHEARMELLEPVVPAPAAFATQAASSRIFPIQQQSRNHPQSVERQQHGPNQQYTNKNSGNNSFQRNGGNRTQRRDNIRCQICNRPGHRANYCRDRYSPQQPNTHQFQQPPQLHLAEIPPPPSVFSTDSWYPDSGATHHVTNNPAHLTTVQPYTGTQQVTIGNGSSLPISHTGSFSCPNFRMTNILVVPSIKKNLLSVRQFSQENDCDFIFSPNSFSVKCRHTGKTLFQGAIDQGLYSLPVSSPSAYHISQQLSLTRWHNRLGHAAFSTVCQLLNKPKVSFPPCVACLSGKSPRKSRPPTTNKSTVPLQLVHFDVWGPAPVLSCQNNRYYICFTDDFSKFSWLYLFQSRDQFNVIFTTFLNLVENQLNTKVKAVQCDCAGEFLSASFRRYLQDRGIYQRTSCPHIHAQNGTAERKHRHIVDMGLSMLNHASVPSKYWDFAFEAAIHIINRLPTAILQNKSPWEVLFHSAPPITHLRTFGCAVFPNLRPYTKHKLEPRSSLCIFLGYPSGYKGYRCYSVAKQKFYITDDAIFDEDKFPFQALSPTAVHSSSPRDLDDFIFTLPSPGDPTPQSHEQLPSSPDYSHPLFNDLQDHQSSIASDSLPTSHDQHASDPSCPADNCSNSSPVQPVPPDSPAHPMITRLRAGTIQRRHLRPDHTYALQTSLADHSTPTCFSQANKDSKWGTAMAEEFTALQHNHTWTLVPPPPQCNPIGCKWVYRVKLRADGTLERYKARLVAKGFHQQEGIDFHETFSPVVKHVTIRTIISIAYSNGWPLRQLDVKNAFLHGNLIEDIYMVQPPGFIDRSRPDYVCHLHKSLYGLKQAPRAWYQRLSSFLISLGFHVSRADSSLFILHKDGYSMFLLVYVDDIILTGSHTAPLSTLITTLQQEFAITDLGDLHYFLGIELQHTTNGLLLHQGKYATDLLNRAQMSDARPVTTPCVVGTDPPSICHGDLLSDPTQYRSIVGALQYLTITRPDIAYAVNTACQYMHAPTVVHWQFVKRILRFLRGTTNHGILFTCSSSLHVHAFSDAGWAGDQDTRRSVGGYGIFLGHNLISWSSRKQRTVARSSTEAEFKCLADTTAELIWLEALLQDLRLPWHGPPVLWCDNISAIYLTGNPVFHARTKHVEIDYHFVRERISQRKLLVQYISTIDQPADIFTKGLSTSRFRLLQTKLTVRSATFACGGLSKDQH